LAGYGFTSLIYANRASWPNINVNTTAVPQDDLIGFATGWFLTAFVIAAFLLLACLNFSCVQLGFSEVVISHLGQDDPVKLLGKRASIFRTSKSRPGEDGKPLMMEHKNLPNGSAPKISFNPSQLELPAPPPPPPPPPAILPQPSSMTLV
jgi:hypothetical protein